MTNLSACGRREQFAGADRDFDLGSSNALKVLEGEPGFTPIELYARFGMNPRPEGQFGDTIGACLKRFEQGVYAARDIEIILALGLWGGGLSLRESIDLVDETVAGKPLGENAALAFRILAALFIGGENAGAAA